MNKEAFFEKADAYLNGNLPESERHAFEQDLVTDTELAEDFRLYQIEQYLSNGLSPMATTKIETLIEKDSDFAKEVAWHRKLQQKLRHQDREEVQSIFPQLSEEELQAAETEHRIVPIRRRAFMLLGIAASILLLVFAGIFLFRGDQTPEQLFADHFEPYPMKISVRGDQDQQVLLNKAIKAYQDRAFSEAAGLFEQLTTTTPIDPQILLYKGISILGSGDSSNAIPIFQSLEDNFLFKEQALWYLALSHLKAEDVQEAKRVLSKITSDPSNIYYENAKIILAKMS